MSSSKLEPLRLVLVVFAYGIIGALAGWYYSFAGHPDMRLYGLILSVVIIPYAPHFILQKETKKWRFARAPERLLSAGLGAAAYLAVALAIIQIPADFPVYRMAFLAVAAHIGLVGLALLLDSRYTCLANEIKQILLVSMIFATALAAVIALASIPFSSHPQVMVSIIAGAALFILGGIVSYATGKDGDYFLDYPFASGAVITAVSAALCWLLFLTPASILIGASYSIVLMVMMAACYAIGRRQYFRHYRRR
ncbi:MAG: hypothetical protein WCT27_04505 [Patescibacteria group bacterium]